MRRQTARSTSMTFLTRKSSKKEIAESAILVNGTSIGMAPKTDRCIITDDSVFRKDLFVFDVIYNPEETLFLKKAKAKTGCRTLNGLNMLLYQGALHHLNSGQEKKCRLILSKKNISRVNLLKND